MALLQTGVNGVATVDSKPLGGFQTVTGGNTTAEAVKDRPPGSKYPVAIESLPDVENVVMTRTFDEARDGQLMSFLNGQVGSGVSNLGRVRRDKNQNQVGTDTCSGILIRVSGPEGNSNGGGDKATLELEWVVSGGWTSA